MNKKTFYAKFRSWSHKKGLHGVEAMRKYVMFTFLEALNEVSDDFVFKGGNLLWHYIKTPRHTIDLDLISLTINSHEEVQAVLHRAGTVFDDIEFSVKDFKEVNVQGVTGANVTMKYQSTSGQHNQFEIDIVYALPTDIKRIKSPVHDSKEFSAATIENIIKDKVSACSRFKSGNTRMKDYDDLWRISKIGISIDCKKLKQMLEDNELKGKLDKSWISHLVIERWKSHIKENKDLPKQLSELFDDVNEWLEDLLKK